MVTSHRLPRGEVTVGKPHETRRCCLILLPIVWSIRHLRESSEVDGKAARNLERLKRFRKFYRHWTGPGDSLAPNEALCPVCHLVIRSAYELVPGDRLYCMPCFSRLEVVRGASGRLEAVPIHG